MLGTVIAFTMVLRRIPGGSSSAYPYPISTDLSVSPPPVSTGLSTPPPSPSPWPTLSPDSSNVQKAIEFIAQHNDLPAERWRVADAFIIRFKPCGFVLDAQGEDQTVHEVLVDENTKAILTGSPVDPQSYWEAEELAFRERFQDQILSVVAEQEKVELGALQIGGGVLEPYTLNGKMAWRGAVIDTVRGKIYEVALD